MSALSEMFNTKTLAVVGASTKSHKTGHIILRNIIEAGFTGEIFPVNPKAKKILGLKCYSSLEKIPVKDIDLVIVIVPARFVEGVLEQAAVKNASGAIIISGGFSEIGNYDLESSVLKIAKRNNIRIIGPNCQGIIYSANNLCATWPYIESNGNLAIISQSGTVAAAVSGWAADDRLGISSMVSLGNKSDVNEIDLMKFFAEDKNTEVIGLYLEGVDKGREFMKTAQKVIREKPVIVLRPGRTEKGRTAVQSHTRSVAGDHRIFDAAVKQAGIIKANSVEELYDYCKIMSLSNPIEHNNCLIITSSGGSGILATDIGENLGVNIVDLEGKTKDSLTTALPAHCVIGNPLDLTGDTDARRYYEAIKALKEDSDYIDVVLLIFGDPVPGAAETTARIKKEFPGKEYITCYIGGGEIEKEEKLKLHDMGIPSFPTPERAMKAISKLVAYNKYQNKAKTTEVLVYE